METGQKSSRLQPLKQIRSKLLWNHLGKTMEYLCRWMYNYLIKLKTMWQKKKFIIRCNFLFCHTFFKRRLLQICECMWFYQLYISFYTTLCCKYLVMREFFWAQEPYILYVLQNMKWARSYLELGNVSTTSLFAIYKQTNLQQIFLKFFKICIICQNLFWV